MNIQDYEADPEMWRLAEHAAETMVLLCLAGPRGDFGPDDLLPDDFDPEPLDVEEVLASYGELLRQVDSELEFDLAWAGIFPDREVPDVESVEAADRTLMCLSAQTVVLKRELADVVQSFAAVMHRRNSLAAGEA